MPNQKWKIKKSLEHLGLDWFILLFRKQPFQESESPYPKYGEIRERFAKISDERKLEDALVYSAILLQREEKRLDKIESKAFTLISIVGTAAGITTGIASLFFGQNTITSFWATIPAILLYIFLIISSMWTIYLAVKVVTVGEYQFTYPNPNDVFKLADASLKYVKSERASSLFYSFSQNQQVVNQKATFLRGAQTWFRNSIILLLLLTLLVAFSVPLAAFRNTKVLTPIPTPDNISQPTVIPTEISSPIPDSSTLMPTISVSPMATATP